MPERVLNVGAGYDRLSPTTVNIDIQRTKGADIVADAHYLPFAPSTFDLVVMTAALQYCRCPFTVVAAIAAVLRPGGLVYIEAPFIQPYCKDTMDRFRFTRDGLIGLFDEGFEILECRASIEAPSALAFLLQRLFGTTSNKYVNHAINYGVSLLVWPLSRIRAFYSDACAGGFFLVGRKR